MIHLCYGAGLNSTAIIAGFFEREIKPDLITFADTGGERPHTYQLITKMNNWLLSKGWPQIQVVKKVDKDGNEMTLESLCLEKNMLPSLAYGFKNCSLKFKKAPQDKFCNNYQPFKEHWKKGNKVTKVIGFDADEERRVENARKHDEVSKKYKSWYPLFEWGWDREDCLEAVKRVGLPMAGKSACFFCPASKLHEIRQLSSEYPELASRALKIEENAELTSVKGLGRRFAWKDILSQNEMFAFERDWEMPCDCFDGGDFEEVA